ncbi:Osmotically-inducible protein OsmY, contains BON domain [Pseudomonas peli]|jgi:osmotically-inducible protein OsmY|uniref:Osmotically-inducible protein OsmY, contains BON domain n=1 Tax=Pseudomonas peli TaxID=592361 RepID=A0AB37ZA81_9PSED|nr:MULTISPECIES: BON domain-containing protein [Pseudomonas]NMY52462.1 BON domain-containing protein [Pseudomonas sp. WS 5011]NMZ67647.1 BON domain-containing protein [Pseudomonas peli]PJE41053.1 MAG: BON domain-containing protein [Pseudomonas sp.] [Pseudomonas sp. FEMGT703P]SCW76121.1 Osmotically-inducible protein OsmY, contains BON domain [Pseudomonas peli]VXC75095.1 Osmotically-inducible protein OsmY, contains BON domain [Pseudomonas sp. 9AZ]|tara:strand:- start:2791 stop:3627 length:837 start_codon:yes stop_codon:yes gene_type:complete
MHQLKTLALATATAGLIGLAPFAAYAAEGDASRELSEARQEGSIWTAFALNRHLNPFTIDVDVENGSAKLTGKVETDVERDLAEQIALGIEGVKKVDNQLTLDPAFEAKASAEPNLSQRFDDATLVATVKSKLLWNSNTEGLDINVNADNGKVSLTGNAQTAEAKELAGRLAANTDGVRAVNNQLSVSATDSTAAKAQNAADDTAAVISDAWITSKVKSSFIYSRNLDGLDISVDTQKGMVSLSGTVLSNAEKQLAIETARNIRGVRGVDADALRIDS